MRYVLKMSPAGAAHCGPCYRDMRGTCGPHTIGPTVDPGGAHTAHTLGGVCAVPLGGAHLGPIVQGPHMPHIS